MSERRRKLWSRRPLPHRRALPAPPPTLLRPSRRLFAAPVVALGLIAAPARADDCAVLESRASLAALSGVRITSLVIEREGPELPGLSQRAASLHPVSSESSVRRQLLFAPGDTVDTLLVGETMRRLRRTRLYSDAVLLAQTCTEAGGVALVLRTRDAWTLRPTARLRSSNSLVLGIEEKNLFGQGRAVALTSEISRWGTGAGVTLVDPWLLGRDIEGSVRVARLGGGRTLRLGLRNHEYSVFDRWRAEGSVARVAFVDTGAADRALHALRVGALVGRRMGGGATAVTTLLAGAEFDSALAVLAPKGAAPGTPAVTRARGFVGADVGVLHRTARYDTASWVVPGRGFLDVPLGWETDVVLGAGYERVVRTPAMKLDAWLGRVWVPSRGRILMLDGWASGYAGNDVAPNHIARLSAGWYEAAPRGFWGARVTTERLVDVDPDLSALSLAQVADFASPALRPFAVPGGASVSASLERAVHLFAVTSASVLDAGAFVAGSRRWQVRDVPGGSLHAGVVGARLRVLSANGAVSSVRIDVGYPIVRSEALPQRMFTMLTIGTLFDVSRQRDGRRGI